MNYQIWDETNEGGKWLYIYKLDEQGGRSCIKAILYNEEGCDPSLKDRNKALGEAMHFIEILKKTEYTKELLFEL